MQTEITAAKGLVASVKAITDFRSPHLESAQAHAQAAQDALVNHAAWLQTVLADAEKEVAKFGTTTEAKMAMLEKLKAAAAAAAMPPAAQGTPVVAANN